MHQQQSTGGWGRYYFCFQHHWRQTNWVETNVENLRETQRNVHGKIKQLYYVSNSYQQFVQKIWAEKNDFLSEKYIHHHRMSIPSGDKNDFLTSFDNFSWWQEMTWPYRWLGSTRVTAGAPGRQRCSGTSTWPSPRDTSTACWVKSFI